MKKSNSLDKLLGAAEQENKPLEKKSYVDERIWKPVMDKTGNGFAIIRFLPAPKGEELPWVKLWNHAFQGPTGQWYIENCNTTLTFTLSKIVQIQKMKVKYSFIVMVRKSLIRSWRQCSLHLKMRLQ